MKYCSVSKKFFLIFFFTLFLINFISISHSFGQSSSLNPKFLTTQNPDRIAIESPVYDNSSHLFMRIVTGILTPSSNPYINISYVNETTGNEEFSTGFIFHQLIEYSNVNNSVNSTVSKTIDQIINIGNNNTILPNLLIKGYNPLTTSISNYQNEILHTINISTSNGLFSMSVNIPEGIIYPNNVQVNVPGIFITINVKNFPFLDQNSNLALNMTMVTSPRNTIKLVGQNEIEIYRDYSEILRNIFYCQNSNISDIQSFYFLNSRILLANLNVITTNRSNSTIELYSGQIDPTALPPGLDSGTNSNSITNGPAGILDYTISVPNLNLQLTTGDLAFASFSLAGLLGLLYFIYYLLKKYLIYILGILLAISVSLYLPTRKVTAIQALHHDKRREIMDILHEAAGSGMLMKDLKEQVDLPQTTLLWHLQILEEFEFITRIKIHKQVIILSNDFIEQFDPRIKELELSFLSEQGEKFRQFIRSKDISGSFSISDVIEKTAWHEKTARRHIKRMVNLGIILPVDKPNTYIVAPEFHSYFINT